MTIYNSTKVLPYVYRLDHKETDQFYIGFRCANKVPSSEDLGTKYFTSSKYVKDLGFENFNIQIIAEFFDKKDALLFEEILIKEYWKHPLSLNKNASGSKFTTLGISIPWSSNRKLKSSLSKIGLKREPLSEKTKQKISLSKQGQQSWLGLKHSEETKAKFSEIAKNRSPETIQKMKNSLQEYYKNNEVSEEIRNKISKTHIGKVVSKETRELMGSWQRGKPKSKNHTLAIKESKLSTYVLEDIAGKIISIKCNFRTWCKEQKLSETILLRSLQTYEFNKGWRLISKTKPISLHKY